MDIRVIFSSELLCYGHSRILSSSEHIIARFWCVGLKLGQLNSCQVSYLWDCLHKAKNHSLQQLRFHNYEYKPNKPPAWVQEGESSRVGSYFQVRKKLLVTAGLDHTLFPLRRSFCFLGVPHCKSPLYQFGDFLTQRLQLYFHFCYRVARGVSSKQVFTPFVLMFKAWVEFDKCLQGFVFKRSSSVSDCSALATVSLVRQQSRLLLLTCEMCLQPRLA